MDLVEAKLNRLGLHEKLRSRAALLFTTTFCTFVREFPPLQAHSCPKGPAVCQDIRDF